jgi:single-stranded-DNA-specific exonuclease
MTYDRWQLKEPIKVSEKISKYYQNHWIQQRLSEFHISDIAEAEGFLDAARYQSANPAELPGLEKSAHRLWRAIQNDESIGIWGDFDVDGQTSTTLLVEGLRELGGNVVFHIPNREKESHGIRLSFLMTFLEENPVNILLTCDTGISENEAVDFAGKNGIDVIITDHHTLPDVLPSAYSIVNPHLLPEGHKLAGLAGVGTAYKLMEYLFTLAGKKDDSAKMLDLTALGTIADVAPLRGENRYLVQRGIKSLQNTNRLLLKEIYQINGFESDKMSETHVSFFLAPMLNSIGRLDDANPVVNLLSSNNLQDTKIFASVLVNLNEKRRFLTEQITKASIEIIEQQNLSLNQPAIVLYHPGWMPGVLGIVANRLVEKFQKPVLILTDKPEIKDESINNDQSDLSALPKYEIFGSGRSIKAINLIDAIRENHVLLTHFGGHAMAAGLSLPLNNLEEFKNGFFQCIKNQIGDQIMTNDLVLDGILSLDKIDLHFVKELESLAPFGAGNPPFKFLSENLTIISQKSFGLGANHLRLTVKDVKNNTKDVIWWRGNDEFTGISENIDIAYQLSSSSYKGKAQTQFELISLRLSAEHKFSIKVNKPDLSIIDFRNKNEFLNTISENYKDILWWKENSSPFPYKSSTRLELHPAKSLVIINCPPNMLTIAKAFLTVNPETLILAGVLSIIDSPNNFIDKLRKMINYSRSHNSGLVDIDRMAAAIGHREATIDYGLRWLAAKGEITMIEHPDTSILIKLGGEAQESLAADYYSQLIFLLQETYKFRKWYFQLDPKKLHQEIMHYVNK